MDEEKHPGHLPRAYTITHSDITAKLTLAVSQTINRAQVITNKEGVAALLAVEYGIFFFFISICINEFLVSVARMV